jgi:hypothetical protein
MINKPHEFNCQNLSKFKKNILFCFPYLSLRFLNLNLTWKDVNLDERVINILLENFRLNLQVSGLLQHLIRFFIY